jgi:hypothetical protein
MRIEAIANEAILAPAMGRVSRPAGLPPLSGEICIDARGVRLPPPSVPVSLWPGAGALNSAKILRGTPVTRRNAYLCF